MKILAAMVLMIMSSAQVFAQAQYSLQPGLNENNAPIALLGIWGTSYQCAAHEAGEKDDPRLLPYIITRDWIRQGFIYCYLAWNEQISDAGDNPASAFAQCGEDNLRDYQIVLNLRDGKLRIQWSEDFTTRELEACR